MTDKELNTKIHNLLNEPKLYDLRCEMRIIDQDLTLEEAQGRLDRVEPEHKHLYAITTSKHVPNYCEDVELALRTAKRISYRNSDTFVLSIEDGTWRAAYGSYNDCEEAKGAHPAYVTCIAIAKFMGKV